MDEPAPQGAPGSGRRLGGSKHEGGGRAEPPKKKNGESGAVKTAGVPQGGTKSEPATQVTGKGRLGGKKGGRRKRRSRTPKTGSEKKALGYRKRETWASKEPVRRVVAEREKGTGKPDTWASK